jgi:hypothetical protein
MQKRDFADSIAVIRAVGPWLGLASRSRDGCGPKRLEDRSFVSSKRDIPDNRQRALP